MNLKRGRLGSGSATYVSGWILSFFDLSGEVEDVDIPRYSIDVPVLITNMNTGKKKKVRLIGVLAA